MLFGVYSVLLPVFVWNTHKEALQFFFFVFVIFTCIYCKEKSLIVDGLVVTLLLLWSFLFRSYYIIIAAGAAFFLVLARLPWRAWSPRQRKLLIGVIICVGVTAFILTALLKPEILIKLFDGRMSVNRTRGNDPDANTIILDVIANPNHTIRLYVINYVLTAFRLMFPLELIIKGVQYVPFVLLQTCWTGLLCRSTYQAICREWTSWSEKRLLAVVLAWYLVAFLFEPDFGSFIRHQAAAFPIVFPLMGIIFDY